MDERVKESKATYEDYLAWSSCPEDEMLEFALPFRNLCERIEKEEGDGRREEES